MHVLSEYGSIDVELSRGEAEAIHGTGYVDVSPAPAGRWRVTASSYVGTLVVGGFELMIRPKISPENLFLLLEPGLPAHAWREEAFDYGSTSDLLPSVIAFFARTVETVLGRGVLRSYQQRSESLVATRGRLDIAGQFKRAGVLTPVSCTFDDYTEDIPENRAIRAAVKLALRVPRVDAGDRQRLLRHLVALEDVADAEVHPEAIDRIHMSRLNQHYAPALGLARLLLANLTLTDARGTTSALSFMVNMNDLFQRFVTERLRRELRGRLDVVDEPTVSLGLGPGVSMLPDLVFRGPDGRDRYVGDLKYKLATNALGRSGDYYQLLAYTTAMNLPGGMLIYCRRPGEISQSSLTVRNAGTRLVLRALDFAGAPAQIEEEIRQLADDIMLSSSVNSSTKDLSHLS